MFTFRPIENAASIIEYHRDSLADYYAPGESEDKNARWVGKLRGLLLPEKEVVATPLKRSFERLLGNRNPVTDEKLTVRSRQKRRSGFDFACCAPKSVSMAHVMRGDDLILKIHKECADEAFLFLEQFSSSRIRKGGKYEDRATGLFMAFATEHESSRHGDPHLHTHFVIPNVTWDAKENRYKALQTCEISQNLALATAIYRNRLACKMREIGYELEHKSDGKFEIKGVPTALIKEYSKSKKGIDEKISAIESETGHELKESIRREIALGLRPNKMSKEEEKSAFSGFRKRMSELGMAKYLCPGGARKLLNRILAAPVSAKKAVNFAVAHIFERSSTVRVSKLFECAINDLWGTDSYTKVFEEFKSRIAKKELLAGNGYATTREMIALENRLVFHVNCGIGRSRSLAARGRQEWKFLSTLGKEQRECLERIISSQDSVMNVQGIAGAGKSFMLHTLGGNLKRQSISFLAVAPSSKATAELRELGEGNVQTMQSLIAKGGDEKLRNGFLIVDEAGLVGVRDMDRLFAIAKEYGTKILFSGDIRQHKSVTAGDALRLLQTKSKMKTFSLKEIRRQKEEEYRNAVYAIFNENVDETVGRLLKIGAIEESEYDMGFYWDIARKYVESEMAGKNTMVVSPTWVENEAITHEIQSALVNEKYLDRSQSRLFQVTKSLSWTEAKKRNSATYDSSEKLYVEVFGKVAGVGTGVYSIAEVKNEYLLLEDFKGEKVRLAYSEAENFDVQKIRRIDVMPKEKLLIRGNLKVGRRTILKRGEVVVAKELHEDGTVLLEDGRKIPPTFLAWTHGYAITTHASQGLTVDNVIVACGKYGLDALTQEQFYVGISRGRESVKVFTTDLEELTKKMGCSNDRKLAVELVNEIAQERVSPTKEAKLYAPKQEPIMPVAEEERPPKRPDPNDDYGGIGY